MQHKVIWFDDDLAEIEPFVNELRRNDFEVKTVTSVSEVERLIVAEDFDLFIMDVMIQTDTEEERDRYPVSATKVGYETGIVFYKYNREILEKNNRKVIALSIRTDSGTKYAFERAGLKPERFLRKRDLTDVDEFMEVIKEIISDT